MPKSKKISWDKQKSSLDVIHSDITVDDFANKKKAFRKLSSVTTVLQGVNSSVLEDGSLWDEKFDEKQLAATCSGCNDCALGSRNILKNKAGCEKKDGQRYPVDLWFLISECIRPEDVGRFGAICQATRYIICSARFWFLLYKRYYRWTPELPEQLNCWNMDHVKGLRASVIKSFFFMYPPFVARISHEKSLTFDESKLNRAQCILQWHMVLGNWHKYFFKFYNSTVHGSSPYHKHHSTRHHSRLPDVVGTDSLVNFNPEDGCYILMVTTSHICKTSMVVGEYLYQTKLGIAANFCSHKLRLSFSPRHLLPSVTTQVSRKQHSMTTGDILFEPVQDVRIYPWWHPQYLSCGTIDASDKSS